MRGRYRIHVSGSRYRYFVTLAEATVACGRVFARTGIVLAIEDHYRQAEIAAAAESDRIAALYDRGEATRAELMAAERKLDRAIRAAAGAAEG